VILCPKLTLVFTLVWLGLGKLLLKLQFWARMIASSCCVIASCAFKCMRKGLASLWCVSKESAVSDSPVCTCVYVDVLQM